MSIHGLLGLNENDERSMNAVGERVVYDAIREYLNPVNAEIDQMRRVFVAEDTYDYSELYKIPSGGRMQRSGGVASPAPSKQYNGNTVQFPIEELTDGFATDDVALGYMTAAGLQAHIDTIVEHYINSMRFEILYRLMNSNEYTFKDNHHGNLTVKPLANGDTDLYPPELGATEPATESHYFGTNFTAANISDDNDPFEDINDHLAEHFGDSTGGDNTVVFINNAQRNKSKALADFVEVPDRFIRVGDDTDIPAGLPMVPGKIIGRCSGVWVVEYRFMPANYMFGLRLDQPGPLVRRLDPQDTGLGSGLRMVSKSDSHPLQFSTWRAREGYGVRHRLNGVAIQLVASTSYTEPTEYA